MSRVPKWAATAACPAVGKGFDDSVPSFTFDEIAPTSGAEAGGDACILTGTGFVDGAITVAFGAAAPVVGTFVNATRVTCTSPASADGPTAVDVGLTINGVTETLVGGFTYE